MKSVLSRALSILLCLVMGVLSSCSQEDSTRGALRAFRELLHEATIRSETPPLERLFKAKRVSQWFHEKVEGTLLDRDSEEVEQKRKLSREAIERHIVGAYRVSRDIHYEVVSESAREENDGVLVSALLRIYGHKPAAGASYLEELQVKLLFKEDSGSWLIHQLIVERVPR